MGVIHVQTTVLPGHRIEIAAPELTDGSRVDVIVLPWNPASSAHQSALEVIRSLAGHRLFQSPDQVRQHLEQERDAWDH